MNLNREHCLRILELQGNPSPSEIKDAYRLLVKVWHPDKYSHDPKLQQRAQEKVKLVNSAYEWLNSHIYETDAGPNESVNIPTAPSYTYSEPTLNHAAPSSYGPKIRDYGEFVAGLFQIVFGSVFLIPGIVGGVRAILGAYTGPVNIGSRILYLSISGFIGICGYYGIKRGKSQKKHSWR